MTLDDLIKKEQQACRVYRGDGEYEDSLCRMKPCHACTDRERLIREVWGITREKKLDDVWCGL